MTIGYVQSKERTVGMLNELRRKRELRKQLRSRDRAHSFPQDGQMKGEDSSDAIYKSAKKLKKGREFCPLKATRTDVGMEG